MPKITVLVGPPGSGKSSLAREMVNETLKYNENSTLVYINQDSQQKEHKNLFSTAIEYGKLDIVLDRMNFNKEQRRRYLEPAKKAGYETEIIVLHQNYETCLNRCNARNDHETIRTPEDANKALSFFFSKYERPTEDESDIVIYKYPEIDLKLTTIICDIDNTLSDAEEREVHMRNGKKNWPAFFSEMANDKLNVWCAKILRNMRTDHIITLLSGRPSDYREVTKDWLEKHKVFHDNLYMRPKNDSRSDVIIKEILLDFEVKTRYSDILFVIDDRKSVIEMWRKRGLIVLDCAGPKGDF